MIKKLSLGFVVLVFAVSLMACSESGGDVKIEDVAGSYKILSSTCSFAVKGGGFSVSEEGDISLSSAAIPSSYQDDLNPENIGGGGDDSPVSMQNAAPASESKQAKTIDAYDESSGPTVGDADYDANYEYSPNEVVSNSSGSYASDGTVEVSSNGALNASFSMSGAVLNCGGEYSDGFANLNCAGTGVDPCEITAEKTEEGTGDGGEVDETMSGYSGSNEGGDAVVVETGASETGQGDVVLPDDVTVDGDTETGGVESDGEVKGTVKIYKYQGRQGLDPNKFRLPPNQIPNPAIYNDSAQ